MACRTGHPVRQSPMRLFARASTTLHGTLMSAPLPEIPGTTPFDGEQAVLRLTLTPQQPLPDIEGLPLEISFDYLW